MFSGTRKAVALIAGMLVCAGADAQTIEVNPDQLSSSKGVTVWAVVGHPELKVVTYLKVGVPDGAGNYMWFTYEQADQILYSSTPAVAVEVAKVVQAYSIGPNDPILEQFPENSSYVSSMTSSPPLDYVYRETPPDPPPTVPRCRCEFCTVSSSGNCSCTWGQIKGCWRSSLYPD